MAVSIRHAKPSDYGRVIGRVNVWWGGRDMAPMLPKLFFLHFEGTSFVAEDEDDDLVGFLWGSSRRRRDDEAYIHFVGVTPDKRGEGLGRSLYERFFDGCGHTDERSFAASPHQRTGPPSSSTRRSGFDVDRVVPDYDGPGEDRVLLVKRLS